MARTKQAVQPKVPEPARFYTVEATDGQRQFESQKDLHIRCHEAIEHWILIDRHKPDAIGSCPPARLLCSRCGQLRLRALFGRREVRRTGKYKFGRGLPLDRWCNPCCRPESSQERDPAAFEYEKERLFNRRQTKLVKEDSTLSRR